MPCHYCKSHESRSLYNIVAIVLPLPSTVQSLLSVIIVIHHLLFVVVVICHLSLLHSIARRRLSSVIITIYCHSPSITIVVRGHDHSATSVRCRRRPPCVIIVVPHSSQLSSVVRHHTSPQKSYFCLIIFSSTSLFAKIAIVIDLSRSIIFKGHGPCLTSCNHPCSHF
jgi:hypothetical protein